MAEIAIDILGKVSGLLIAPIGRQFSYLFKFTGNVETLKNELEKLRNLKNNVEEEVTVARNNVDTILNTVETWLKDVDLVDDKAQSIVEEKARFSNGCFNNWCLNLKSRYVLSRRAKKRTREINELQQEGKFPKVSLPAPPILFMGSTSTYSDSRELILSKIIESLRDEDINIIGICGMGGIGKTTMVEEVFKRVKEETMFDDYAKTVVSQRAEMINVQRDIAEMLGLRLEENNPVLRASRLNQRLVGKKVLIIVDDVWEQFDLQSLGITLQDGQSKCKIVFTSRIQGLWMDFGSRRHELSLDPLTHSESWKLFTEKIGNNLDDNSELVSVAVQIVNECAGHPLALVTLGSALLGKSKPVWNDTLLKLRTISKTKDKVRESIRLSYDYLDDEEAKSLFLLCSLFEEDSLIDVERLVNMGWGLRLFRAINRVEEARDRVFTLVEQLQSRCLVSVKFDSLFCRSCIHFRKHCFVKVHDVVRDVSKYIASTEKGSLVIENGDTLDTALEPENCTWISLISEKNMELPPILQFPRLKLLLCNNKDLQIHDSFFAGMVTLQVVDISCSSVSRVLKLPSSLQYLTNLHTLCLGDFVLEGFTTIKYLESLEILRIVNKFIEELPKEIGQLSKLRLLDISDCKQLKKIPPGIISGLSSLVELYLGVHVYDWGADKTEEGRNAVRREFELLSNLCYLHILTEDSRILPRTPVFKDLKKYKIYIGHLPYYILSDFNSQNFGKILSICNVSLDTELDFLVHSSEALFLMGKPTKRLVYELVQGNSQMIRFLHIQETDTPDYLADTTGPIKGLFLVSELESLKLKSLNNLQQIINGPLVAGNIAKLKKLVVSNCKRLMNIFLLSNALDVLHFEKLHVSDCENMEAVFFWEGREKDSTSKLQFPKLVDLEIGGESLVCFCKGAKELEFDQLERLSLTDIESIISISDENCANPFFVSKVVFPKLLEMELSKLKNMKEIWCGQIQSGSFYNLSTLKIEGCDILEYVFSPYMARYLVHLQNLFIGNCPNLKEIVNGPLMIRSLLKLKRISVYNYNQLRNIFQLSTAVYTMDFTELWITNCGSMEEVISWEGRPQDSTNSLLFPKLYNLDIRNASSLVCICIGAMQIEFQQLAYLCLEDIPAIECLVSISNGNPLKCIFPHKVVFPKLLEMKLSKLKNMKEIWCGQILSGSFSNLSRLIIEGCDSLEYVFSPYMVRYLVHLQHLFIQDCPNLKEIVNGPLMVGSLLKLKDITVDSCHQLKNIFRLSTAVDTMDLTSLSIYECGSMEEVISWEGRSQDSTTKLLFPKLDELDIKNASSLVCFCIGAMQNEFQQLHYLCLEDIPAVECLFSISNENSLKSFFPHKVSFGRVEDLYLSGFNNLSRLIIERCDSLEYVFSPDMARYLVHLQRLFVEDCPNLKEIVNGPLMVGSLLKLEEVTVDSCNQLRNIFRLSTAVDTTDLTSLSIYECGSMEEVISWEGKPQDSTSNLLFPKLCNLNIRDASSLVCFCIGAMQIEFQQLAYLRLKDIPAIECLVSISNENSLKSFFPHKVLFPKLTRMDLYKLKNMKHIWCGQLQYGSFYNLSSLYISKCDSLEYVFSPCTARYLVHLRKVDIFACKNLKEVVSAKKEVDGIEEYTRSILPKLKDVKLCKLLALERFDHVDNEIEFLDLDDITVVDCPVFKSFSPGFVYTPILDHVNLYEDTYGMKEEEKVTMWKGDLNSTIQHLHEDQQQRRQLSEEDEEYEEDEEESGDEEDIKEES